MTRTTMFFTSTSRSIYVVIFGTTQYTRVHLVRNKDRFAFWFTLLTFSNKKKKKLSLFLTFLLSVRNYANFYTRRFNILRIPRVIFYPKYNIERTAYNIYVR